MNDFDQTFDELNQLYESVLELDTPYMLRKDGQIFSCKELLIHPYINTLPTSARNKEAAYKFLIANGELDNYKWFLQHSQNEEIKPKLKALIDQTVSASELDTVLGALSYKTNQEFCRVRTSGKFLGSTTNRGIYFRISSAGTFNWFDLIWQIVYDNRNLLRHVTICTDEKALGMDQCYKYRGVELNRIPVEGFLMLPGNPVIEQAVDENRATTLLSESFELGV